MKKISFLIIFIGSLQLFAQTLNVRSDGEKLYFDWAYNPNIFLYEKENCNTCTWEMYPEHLVTNLGGSYTAWDYENSRWFGRKEYRLGPTFSYTVRWEDQNYPDLLTYQVFFYGGRGHSYHHDVGAVTTYTFKHLDPTKLPWVFTVYALLGNHQNNFPHAQLEIKKIVVTEIPNIVATPTPANFRLQN
jgi:hypothetical protein